VPKSEEVKIIRTSGSHNCGGRCIIKAHVLDNRIIRITSDDDVPDSEDTLQLRGCLKCRGYRDLLYSRDRLLYPLKRTGKRGSGKFERVSWDEALDTIASNLSRVMRQYGPDAIFMNYATGNAGRLSERAWMKRLLGLNGGYLSYYGSYSTACTQMATPYTYGTANTGSSREDWANSKVIILMGFNPAETTHGTNTAYYLKKAKEAGAKIICIDPLYSDTTVAHSDEWIPIRPTTDNALLDAMAYVMIQENIHDQLFLDTYCLGFDENHMPEGVPKGLSYKSYVLGLSCDKTPKTPVWAETITGIPKDTIIRLAREYATNRPGALIQGYGPQRHAYGEQVARGGAMLAAMTGNVGVKGGWASGAGFQARNHFVAAIPGHNPNRAQISAFNWPDAILRGKGMGPELGVRGADRLNASIKILLSLGGNCLINQHCEANATAKLLEDESLVELIVVNDHFMTSSALYADIVLPADDMFERDDIVLPWDYGDYVLYMNKAVDTVGECKNGYDWVSGLAKRLGLYDEFTQGRTQEQWLRYLVEKTAEQNPGFPSFEEFKEQGIYRWRQEKPYIAFSEQIKDPKNHPFSTPSGKIELFSKRLFEMEKKGIPPIAQYISAWEGPEDSKREKYPLQCIGRHSKNNLHSITQPSEWMREAEKHAVWMNPLDAKNRELISGDVVKVFNDRGIMVLPVKVTPRIMPGVVSIPQGAWRAPDEQGVDRGGCVNTITNYRPTPLAFGNPSHTSLVQIVKAEEKECEGN